ncbi:HAD family hydrolase [Gymnodinialimonas ulvae]|uniref:HAD family hydrolase n=1 Tax=Gymnodinialimonas ulvae TaxID=3126504 RepID=UPI0030AECBEC
MTPDLVIFDCDGVLVDSERPANEVMIASIARYGVTVSIEYAMEHFVGGTMQGVFDKARALGADLPDDWIPEIYAQIFDRLREGVDAIPGVIDVLDRLDAAGVPYCVASNGAEAKMAITLGGTGIADRMGGRLFSAYTLGVSKPDPELFLIAAREMGVAPDRAVVIEDSPSGALGAERAGMRCFGYAPHGDDRLAAHGARVFRDMADLPELLGLT